MAKRRRKSISREQADVAPPVVEAVVARKVVVAEIDRPATGHRVAAAVSARQVTALRVAAAVSALRVVVAVREATDRLAKVLVARQPQNSIRRLAI